MMAGGGSMGGGTQAMPAGQIAAYNGANDRAAAAAPGGSTGGKGTSQNVPPPTAAQMNTGGIFGNSQPAEVHPITHPAGKGTSEAMSSHGGPSAQGGDWYSNLMRNVAMRQMNSQTPANTAGAAAGMPFTYEGMMHQAQPEGPQKPWQKPEQPKAAEPAPDKVAELQAQIAALQQAQQIAQNTPQPYVNDGSSAPGYAHGGEVEEKKEDPSNDEIVRHALEILRRNMR